MQRTKQIYFNLLFDLKLKEFTKNKIADFTSIYLS